MSHQRGGMATILSQILVDKDDPAFLNPTKVRFKLDDGDSLCPILPIIIVMQFQFVGPLYSKKEADELGLIVKPDGDHFRRVVPSPLPIKMVDGELRALKLLTDAGCVVICGGGGGKNSNVNRLFFFHDAIHTLFAGIPVVEDKVSGRLEGVEAVIDKDRAATMIGVELQANGLLILTDVSAVAIQYKKHGEKWIRSVSPSMLARLMDQFPSGSMGPKVASAIDFVRETGRWSAIGSLNEAEGILAGETGTMIKNRLDGKDYIEFYDRDPQSFPRVG